MSREDAVKTLKAWMECMITDCDYECEHCHIQADMVTDVLEACAVAVTELSQIDTDTVSRQGAIEAVKNALDPNIVSFVKAKIAIENLPPSQLIQPPAIPAAEPELYGYRLDYLIAFATACRRAGVEEEDLKTFANNLDFAFQIASEELRRQQMEAVAKSMGGKQE